MNFLLKMVKPLWVLTVITVSGGAVATVSIMGIRGEVSQEEEGKVSCTAALDTEV
jgi:hypothetical protein